MPKFKVAEWPDGVNEDLSNDSIWYEVNEKTPEDAAANVAKMWWKLWIEHTAPPDQYDVIVVAPDGKRYLAQVHITPVPLVKVEIARCTKDDFEEDA